MAISVDPQTFVITVPKADLTLVQTSPTEIRQLDLNIFRLALKDWEDDGLAGGITFLRTHTHNTEVLLGGITYARVIEILEPYTITFEDGQYAVNLIGANSNVGDRVNVNQVSVRSQNSAGLISNSAIEFSSFGGGVWIDVDNLSGLAVSGTTFPVGTRQAPVDNIDSLKLITAFRGFNKVFVIGNLNLTNGDNFTRFTFEGESPTKTTITVDSATNVLNCEFIQCTVSGVLDGNSEITHARVSNLDFVDGKVESSDIGPGIISLGTSTVANIFSCFSTTPGSSTPVIDMNGTGIIGLRDYNGGVELRNYSGTGSHSIDLASGQIKLDPNTIISGTFVCRGVGKLIDVSTNAPIRTGIWNGGVTIINELINLTTISEAASFTEAVYIDAINGVPGISDPIGLQRQPVNNLTDAISIAIIRGTSKLVFLSDFTFISTDYIIGYSLIGKGMQTTTLTFETGCVVAYCDAYDMKMTGFLTGIVGMTECHLENLESFSLVPSSQSLVIRRCKFSGTITLRSNYSGMVSLLDSYGDTAVSLYPIFDGGNYTGDMLMNNWSGQVRLKNLTQGNKIDIRITHGTIELDNSVTNAIFHVSGTGFLTDTLENEILSGTWNGGVIVSNETITGSGGGGGLPGVWSELEKQEALAYSKKASDNAEQANLKL